MSQAARRLLLLIGLSVLACALPAQPPATPISPAATPAIVAVPTITAAPVPGQLTPLPQPTPWPPDTGWELLRPGLERRWLHLFDETGQLLERVYLLRLAPEVFRFEVAYRPGAPLPLADWLSTTGALVVLNAGYFTESYVATGLIIAGGEASGQSYGAYAGMLALTPAGPDLRWLQQEPYDAAEPLLGAVQSFPVLVQPGGVAAYPDDGGQRARRTVVGQDGAGRILFIVAPLGHFSLYPLSQFLVDGDLDLEMALNLDGGASTGLLLAEPAESFHAFGPLPAIIAVFPR